MEVRTVLEPSYIKILVEPIGEINAKVFQKYVQLLKTKFSILPIYSLTRFSKENVKSPFVNQNWKTSYIRLRYITRLTARTKAEKNMCTHEKIHGYIGIMSCKKDVKETYQTYIKRKKRLKNANVSRLFAVEYNPEKRPIKNDFHSLKELIIILPTEDMEKLRFYVERSISDLVNSLIRFFEKKVVHPDRMKIFGGGNISSMSVLESIKRFSEHALLVGDVYDSLDGFRRILKSAYAKKLLLNMIDCRESVISCLCLQRIAFAKKKSKMDSKNKNKKKGENNDLKNIRKSFEGDGEIGLMFDIDSTFFMKILKAYNEVLDLQEKKKVFYPNMYDSLVRIINFIIRYREVVSFEVFQKEIMEKFSKLEGLTEDLGLIKKIIVLKSCAKLYGKLGFKRKVGFMFWKISKIYYKLSKFTKAMEMITSAFESFKIPITIYGDKWEIHELDLSSGWQDIQIFVLKDLVMYSKSNYLFRGRILFYLLANFWRMLSKKEQESCFRELDKIFLYVNNIPKELKFCMTKFPILYSIHPLQCNDIPNIFVEKKEEKEDVFLFRPTKRKNAMMMKKIEEETKIIRFVQNEICTFEIILINPYLQDIILRALQIKVNLNCVIYSTGTYLKAKQYIRLHLRMIPKETGELKVDFLSFYLNKVANQIKIDFDLMKENNTQIFIIEAIPLLDVSFKIPSLNVFEGEVIENLLIIQNVSDAVVEYLELKCSNDFLKMIEWDGSIVSKALPMSAKGCVIVPMTIKVKPQVFEGKLKCVKREFHFEVTYGKDKWRRTRSIKLKVKWERSLKFRTLEQNGMKIMEVGNISDQNFVLYLKNKSHLEVPPGYSKKLLINEEQSIEYFVTQNNQPIPFENGKLEEDGEEDDDE